MKHIILLLTILFGASSAKAQNLVINELMQSNIECIMDDIKEFPDSWVELYNPTDAAINLQDYKISIKNKVNKAYQLPNKQVPAGGYIVIYCDKEEKGLHTDFRLEFSKGCVVYLFKDDKLVDSASVVDALKKQPAPNVAYGRVSDGSVKWGYELKATPGYANGGGVCKRDHILGDPIFSELGSVKTDNSLIYIGHQVQYTPEQIEEKMERLRSVLEAEPPEVRTCMLSLIQEPQDSMYAEIPISREEEPVTV